MTYCRFDGQEGEFEEWVFRNPGGIVVNSSPGRLNPTYLKAHRPKCSSFWNYIEARTNYSKHCFDSAAEAIEYLRVNEMGKPGFGCTACRVAALEPTPEFTEFEKRVAVLLAEGVTQDPPGNMHPSKVEISGGSAYYRDPLVAARVQQYAEGKCELCRANAPFRTVRGTLYLEIHHVRNLADGGSDTVCNTVALCPNCHRAAHYARDARTLTRALYDALARLRPQ
jgi:5-methylcytosine-specific restriction endonuclease McrA